MVGQETDMLFIKSDHLRRQQENSIIVDLSVSIETPAVACLRGSKQQENDAKKVFHHKSFSQNPLIIPKIPEPIRLVSLAFP
jgi:hypothetical protein